MFGRIVLTALVLVLAWNYAWLILLLVGALLPFLVAPFNWVMPTHAAPTDLAGYFSIFAAAVVLWLTIKALIFSLSWGLPQYSRFTATKPVRRIQGAAVEVFIWLLFYVSITAAMTITGTGRNQIISEMAQPIYERLQRERAAQEAEKDQGAKDQGDAASTRIKALEAEYMDNLRRAGVHREGLSWRPRLYRALRIEALGLEPTIGIYISPPFGSQYDAARETAKKEAAARAAAAHTRYEAAKAEIDAGDDNERRVFDPLDEKIKEQQDIVNKRSMELGRYREGPAETGRSLRVKAEEEATQSISNPLVMWGLTAKGAGPTAAFLAFILYLIFGRTIKYNHVLPWGAAIRFFEKGRFGIGGSARFASLVEEWPYRFKPGVGMLFFGRSLYNRFLHIGMKSDQHMLTISPSRGGKGSTVIINNLLVWGGSCIVIDPKGTNTIVTAAARKSMGQNVHVLDPFNLLGEGKSQTFNPFDRLTPYSQTIWEDIAVLADALVIPSEGKNAEHFDEQSRTVIAGLISRLVHDPRFVYVEDPSLTAEEEEVRRKAMPQPTLPMIRDMLNQPTKERALMWTEMQDSKIVWAPDAAGIVDEGAGGEELGSIMSNVRKSIYWLGSNPIRDILSGAAEDALNFPALKDKPGTIYLIVPPNYLDVHRRFIRLFINSALLAMPKGGRGKVPVLMIIDEFQQLKKMNEVAKAFRVLAGYNFFLWPFIQDWNGVVQMYGGDAEAFIASSRAVQVFATSGQKDLQWISESIGMRSLDYVMRVDSAMRSFPLRTPDEVGKDLSQESNGQYILRSGKQAPLVLEKVRYYEDEGEKGSDFPDWFRRLIYPFAGLYAEDPDYKRPN